MPIHGTLGTAGWLSSWHLACSRCEPVSHETTVLAHRGNTDGPDRNGENGLVSIHRALQAGWGLELDIRRDAGGRFYISHDPARWTPGTDADAVFALLRRHPKALVALNLKELGYEAELLTYLDGQGVAGRCVLFDMELIEPVPGETARTFRRLHATIPLAARVSDRREPIERALAVPGTSVVWLDEFDGPWATRADVRRLRAAGRRVWAVSPDLHGFPLRETRARWDDFVEWGVDGICTDYPRVLAERLARRTTEACA